MFRDSKRLKAAYRHLFSQPDGEQILRDLAHTHFMYTNTLVENDPLTSAFNEGQRAVVLRILQLLRKEQAWMLEEVQQ